MEFKHFGNSRMLICVSILVFTLIMMLNYKKFPMFYQLINWDKLQHSFHYLCILCSCIMCNSTPSLQLLIIILINYDTKWTWYGYFIEDVYLIWMQLPSSWDFTETEWFVVELDLFCLRNCSKTYQPWKHLNIFIFQVFEFLLQRYVAKLKRT